MSPLPEHENRKELIGDFVGIIAMEKAIRMRRLGSMTLRRRSLGKGLEPDRWFYKQDETGGRRTSRIDLTDDPVPDLAIGIAVTQFMPASALRNCGDTTANTFTCSRCTTGRMSRLQTAARFHF